MIHITSAQWSAWLALLLFPFVRILALVASSPVLGNKQVPVRVKIGLSLLLTIIIAPTLDMSPDVEAGSAIGMVVIVQQILAGLAMGFSLRLIFTAVEMCGEFVGMQMGLGFASFYDPVNASFMPVVAQFLGIVGALAFLGMNGHLLMLEALAESFHAFPISASAPHAMALHTLVVWGGSIFAHALQLSLPVIGALLIANLALAVLTRSAPQLNIFQIGFPITLAVGFAALALSMPYFAPALDQFTRASLGLAAHIMQQLAAP